MKIEQIDLVRDVAPVETAFLCHDHVEAIRIAVYGGGAHASRCAFPANDDGVDAQGREMRSQGGSIETAGALLRHDDVAILRCPFRPDLEGIDTVHARAAIGDGEARRLGMLAIVAGRIEDRQPGLPCRREEPDRRLDCGPGIDTARRWKISWR